MQHLQGLHNRDQSKPEDVSHDPPTGNYDLSILTLESVSADRLNTGDGFKHYMRHDALRRQYREIYRKSALEHDVVSFWNPCLFQYFLNDPFKIKNEVYPSDSTRKRVDLSVLYNPDDYSDVDDNSKEVHLYLTELKKEMVHGSSAARAAGTNDTAGKVLGAAERQLFTYLQMASESNDKNDTFRPHEAGQKPRAIYAMVCIGRFVWFYEYRRERNAATTTRNTRRFQSYRQAPGPFEIAHNESEIHKALTSIRLSMRDNVGL